MNIRYFRYYVTLLILWIILSGHFECFFVVSGIFSCLFTILFCQRLSSLNIWNKSDGVFFFRFIAYIGWLMLQVVLSSAYIAKKVWQLSFNPQVIVFQSQQRNSMSLALFTNSVTLTPGTMSVDAIQKDPYKIIISTIDKKLIDGLNDMDHKVAQLFLTFK
ncbi:Na+/H+ antiporter subunit E [Candidatus Mesenet endosymbiont of Agriotes lineatus]|uniref:Na+/H+ antiporter subunit E n=1 Tax=Candidatus Mesenet endosymbiont of Agriotes lineatus TaxID=3077948 RepID=UPI0030CB4629